jgi:hypothetical protein
VQDRSDGASPAARAPLRGGHPLITWAAMNGLPAWQRRLWQDRMYELAATHSFNGDAYSTHRKELGPFVELPDGTLPPWEIGCLRLKKNYAFAVDFWESPFYEQLERSLDHLFARIAGSIAAGDMARAARFAGTAAHMIEDSGVPAHAADHGDLEFVKDYLGFPPAFVCFPLHGYTEASPGPFRIDGYRPRLFGETAVEAAGRYVDRYVGLTLSARRLLFPLAQCAYRGAHRRAAALRRQAARACAEAYADFMYTATCIGRRRFAAAECRSLRVLRLADRWPYRSTAWAPSPYFETGPLRLRGINLDAQRRPVPCALIVREGRAARPRRFREALGSGAYYEYHYRLPRGVFARFTARVGIHATLGARRTVDVAVKMNRRTAFQATVAPGRPALDVELDARGCRDLQLIASGPWLTDPDGSDNHVVWAEPRMWRTRAT